MNRKSIRIIIGFILALALLAGCSPAAPVAEEPAEEAPAEPAAEEAEPAAEVIELDVFHFYGEGVADQPQMLEWGAKFEEMYPQYKIKWTWGGSEAMNLFRARINADDPPDVYLANDATVAALAREGVIEPLDKYLDTQNYEEDAKWADTFRAGLLQNGYIEDGTQGAAYYGIPDNMHFGAIFYNKGLFEENGYQVPTTWSEMLALCDQIQAEVGIPCFGADNFNGYNARPHFYIMSRIAGPEALYAAGTGQEGASFDTPEFLEAAQMYQQLMSEYYQPGWQGNQWPAGQVDWANGGQAMIFMPSWLPSELMTTKAEGFTMDVFPVPVIEGGYDGKPAIEAKYNGWVVPVGAEHPDEAIFFVKYLTSREYQQDRTERASMPSVLAAVDLPTDLQSFKPVFEQGEVYRFAFGLDADAQDWLKTVFYPLNDSLAYGDITPEEFIAELEAQTKAFYSQ